MREALADLVLTIAIVFAGSLLFVLTAPIVGIWLRYVIDWASLR